jgi:hypothetical protein
MGGIVRCTCIHLGNRVSRSEHDTNRVTCHSAAGSGSQTNAQGLLTMTLTEGPVLGGGAFSRVSIVTEEVRDVTLNFEKHDLALLVYLPPAPARRYACATFALSF